MYKSGVAVVYQGQCWCLGEGSPKAEVPLAFCLCQLGESEEALSVMIYSMITVPVSEMLNA
ncbi:hypothetical protein E2C01_063264 [Portunus trituberculatus]|uniref:Uncharacterized protein n=1 Tax=Portunus trituberculatus TaxID=210409 RepID=A0A5B7H8Q6_PORTR|nr:hypothetical protein [Portunus trituberculatus]